MDSDDLRAWFGEYLDVFAACGRGELEDVRALLDYYGVPLLVTTDDAAVALTTEEQVVRAIRPQLDGMRAAAYDHGRRISVLAVHGV